MGFPLARYLGSAFDASLASERSAGLAFRGFAMLPGTFRYVSHWLGPDGSGWLVRRRGRYWRVDELNEARDALAAAAEYARGEDEALPAALPPAALNVPELPIGSEVPVDPHGDWPSLLVHSLCTLSEPGARRLGMTRLHDVQRERIATGLLSALRAQYPGRSVSVNWKSVDG